MVCKYFLPFHKLPFHLVDCCIYCAEGFQFDVVPLVFPFVAFAFGIKYKKKKKIIAQTDIKELNAYVFFQEFNNFRSLFKCLIHFEFIFVYDVSSFSFRIDHMSSGVLKNLSEKIELLQINRRKDELQNKWCYNLD